MKNKIFICLALLAMSLTFWACPDDMNDNVPCQYPNYIRQNGDCVCPEGYYEISSTPGRGSCVERKEGTFFMSSSDCFCNQAFVLELPPPRVDTPYLSDAILYYGIRRLYYDTSVKYYPMPDGDSIAIKNTMDLNCNNVPHNMEMYGKFNPERTAMDAQVILYDEDYDIIDTCTFLLRK